MWKKEAGDRAEKARELIERFRAGQRQAFARIYELYKSRAYGFAYRFLGSAEEAEDVTQEAFVRVYRYIDSFDETLSFEAWLHRIIYNLCMDIRKSLSRAHSGLQGYADEARPLEAGRPSIEDEESVMHYLSLLDESDRAIVILYYLQDHTYEEISRILSVPIGTVKSRLFRAREKLRKIAVRKD